MRYDPKNPHYHNNDRFILSKGHAAPLLYAALGGDRIFSRWSDLLTLRKFDSDLEGHPTPRLPFVDVATGSLGQGLSVGVGMALRARLDNLDYRTYVLLGDGEIAEGSVWEAASLAGIYKLNNLIAIVDVNRLGQSQPTAFGHDIDVYRNRFEAFGWRVEDIDGHDLEEILEVLGGVGLERAAAGHYRQNLQRRRRFLPCRTRKAGTANRCPRKKPPRPSPNFSPARNPASACPFPRPSRLPAPEQRRAGQLSAAHLQSSATRSPRAKPIGNALARMGDADPRIVAMDGDTKNSTYSEKFFKKFPDRFIECFIAEQNMVGVAIGFGTRGKVPFASTFAAFFTRAYDQIRMAGISQANLKLAGSHVGVSIGEDGPSQMGLEDLAMMRAIVGSTVLYPSDAVAAEKLVEQMAAHHGICLPAHLPAQDAGDLRQRRAVPHRRRQGAAPKRRRQSHRGRRRRDAVRGAQGRRRAKAKGIGITVIDAYSIKPLAKDVISAAAQKRTTPSSPSKTITPKAAWATPSRANSAPRASTSTSWPYGAAALRQTGRIAGALRH